MTFAGEFLGLPGLRAYWPMNAFDASGNTIDQAGLDLVLTLNGNPTYNYTTEGAGYCDLDGTGDYLSRADEASLDILGTETSVASAVRGLTVGGWFWTDTTPASSAGLIAKDNLATNRHFALYMNSSRQISLEVSGNGSTLVGKTNTTTVPATGTWFFAAGVYVPSTSVNCIVNSTVPAANTTSIPASIFNGSGPLAIGALNTSFLLNGRVSNCFLCAMALSTTAITDIYNNTKAAYGL